MANIPQIYRDRLTSSVVGTPGVDTSGQQLGQEGAQFANNISNLAFTEAIHHQETKDTAETNRLLVGFKLDAIKNLERHKQDFAGSPEASGPAFQQEMQNSLNDFKGQASNERVKEALSKGDPYFEGRMAYDQAQWAVQQRERLDKTALYTQANDLANQANKIASDNSISFDEKKQQLLPLFSAVGNLSAGAFALAHPDAAAKFEAAVPHSIYKGTIYGMISNNPAQAIQFLQDPEVKKVIPSAEREALQTAAVTKMKGFADRQKWVDMTAPLVDHPQMVQDVLSGKTDWSQLDQMPQNPLVKELKKMALNNSPQSVDEQQKAQNDFFKEAHDIGIGVRGNPPERSVAQLVKFSTDLAKAYNGGLITKSVYEKMNRQLSSPLISSVMKAHDPNWFDQQMKSLGSWVHQTGKDPQDVVDKYTGGYDVINKFSNVIGKSDDWKTKANLIQNYLDFKDKVDADPNLRDAQNRIYTPKSLAQKSLGIAVGDVYETPLGKRTITGHDRDGMPTFTFSNAEKEQLDHLKKLRIKLPKAEEK